MPLPSSAAQPVAPKLSRREVRFYVRVWRGMDDGEVGAMLGVPPGLVASVRAEERERVRRFQRDFDLAQSRELAGSGPLLAEARELAALTGHVGPLSELVLDVVREAIADAVYEQRVTERQQAVAEHAQSSGDRRSADGTVMRSLLPAQAAEGESGRKGPESTATARSRESTSRDGRGSGAARDGDVVG